MSTLATRIPRPRCLRQREKGDTQIVKLLLDAKADVNKATKDGATPLYIAAQEGQLEVVKLLLDAKS